MNESLRYKALVVPMPYGEWRAMEPAILSKANPGAEFDDVNLLVVTGGEGVTSVGEFRDRINTAIKYLNVNCKTPGALETIKEALMKEGDYSIRAGYTRGGDLFQV